MDQLKNKKLIIAGGGTGGHILPGVAIAEVWCSELGAGSDVLFVGAKGALEERLVPRAGYKLKTLRLGSLNRVGLSRKIRTIIQLPLSFVHSFLILVTEKPRVVLGVGGYASGPLVLLSGLFGWMWGGETFILEPNSMPGLTNRLLGRFVRKIFAAMIGTEQYFPRGRVLVTGTPIRSTIIPLPAAARTPFVVFIFGGSQGAMGINAMVLEALPHLKDLMGVLSFIHQTGELDYERVSSGYGKLGIKARVEKFIYDMPAAYAQASLLVCRAGASTLSEAAAVRRAAVLVPLPTAADDHQKKNAKVLSETGAARLLEQGPAAGRCLADIIRELVDKPGLVDEMENKIAEYHRPDAAKDIVKALITED